MQARRARLAFLSTRLVVRLDHISELDRQRQGAWPDDLGELERDHAERYAFAHADLQILTDPEMTAHATRLGWTVRPGARALSDDLPADVPPASRFTATPRVTVCVPYYNLPCYLPATLESLVQQTYPHLEVLVIDDGSTQPEARAVFDAMQARYPAFRFLRQDNAGIGATRNRGLREATGTYFLPMDADNIARPDMVERFVTAIEQRPDVVALTCYFLAFATDDDLQRGKYLHAYRPPGGPHVLAGLRNVYGDATAIFRTDAFRAVGGYETDRGTSFEDWEAFLKLVHVGGRIDVIPAHLFYYRHLPAGFSRTTSAFANRQRVLRQFAHLESLSLAERRALLDLLTGVQLRVEYLTARQRGLRYRLADRLHALAAAVPLAGPLLRWLTRDGTARPPAVRQGD